MEKYQLRYMNGGDGEQLGTNLSMKDAQTMARARGDGMHPEMAADLVISPAPTPSCVCGNTTYWQRTRTIHERHTLDLDESTDWSTEYSGLDNDSAYECAECGEPASENAEKILGELC